MSVWLLEGVTSVGFGEGSTGFAMGSATGNGVGSIGAVGETTGSAELMETTGSVSGIISAATGSVGVAIGSDEAVTGYKTSLIGETSIFSFSEVWSSGFSTSVVVAGDCSFT